MAKIIRFYCQRMVLFTRVGLSADGQTGLGHYECVGVPQKVQGDLEGEKIVQVASTSDGALAVSGKYQENPLHLRVSLFSVPESGHVFGWGNSEYNQLQSVTDLLQLNIPKRLPLTNVGKVVRVAAGGTSCAVLNG